MYSGDLAAQNESTFRFSAKCLVEGNQPQTGNRSERQQVRVGPLLGQRASPPRVRAERLFQPSWFVEERNARVVQPTVINPPSFWLGHYLLTHHGLCCKQPQKAELSDSAETETRFLIETRKPARSNDVVEMPVRRQGNPDVYIREKE